MLAVTLLAAPALADDTHVTASMVLKVAQRDAAASALIEQAEAAGGWFASQSLEQVSLRIPTEQIDPLITFAAEQGLVADRSFNSSDLTAQLTDLRAQLAAREKVLEQYFALLPDAKQSSVLTVEREIVRVVSEVESIKGRLRVLEHQAEWAELDVYFEFRERAAPVRDGSSSFAWLNTLNLSDMIYDFQYGSVDRSPRSGVSEVAPEGFSPYLLKRERRAVSPDEVLFRVRAQKHEPEADLDFWEEATRERMLAAGYNLLREESIQADGVTGFLHEYTAPQGTEDYTYALAVFPNGKKLVIAEAAGEMTRYEARRAAIVASIQGLTL